MSFKRGCTWINKFSCRLNIGYRRYGMDFFSQFELKMVIHAARTKKICEVNNF